jgi:putative hydroxymethylpyrimidine transport system substrate-binding protein
MGKTILLSALTLVAMTLGACAPLSAPATPTQKVTQVTVALDWYPWSNHTGLYLAQQRRYLAAEGIEARIYTPANPDDVLKLVGAGKDTFGISYQTDVLLARAEGLPVVSIAALVQHPLNSIMTLKSSGITRPKQLEGKKVGYPGIPSDEAYLATMMKADGSSMDRVQLVNVGFDLVQSLISGKVDAIIGAYWVHESILAEKQGHPVNIMRVEEWGVPDYYELVLVTSESYLKEHPEVVMGFLRALAKGYADALVEHKAALDALVKASPETDRSLEEKGIELLAPLWKAPQGQPWGWQDPLRWNNYYRWMRDNGLLTRDMDPAAAFTNDFLPPKPRLVE